MHAGAKRTRASGPNFGQLDFGAKLRTAAIESLFYRNICCFFVEKILCETIHCCGCDAPYLHLICSLAGIPNLNIFSGYSGCLKARKRHTKTEMLGNNL